MGMYFHLLYQNYQIENALPKQLSIFNTVVLKHCHATFGAMRIFLRSALESPVVILSLHPKHRLGRCLQKLSLLKSRYENQCILLVGSFSKILPRLRIFLFLKIQYISFDYKEPLQSIAIIFHRFLILFIRKRLLIF